MRTLGHREIVKLDQSLPARKGQEWDSNPSSEAQWPILNPPPLPNSALATVQVAIVMASEMLSCFGYTESQFYVT